MASRVITLVFLIISHIGSFCNGVEGDKFRKEVTKLEKQRKRAVTTIKTEYGDIYDCVDIYKQPSLDHPALVDHKIQMRPGKEFENMLHRRPSKEFENMLPQFRPQKAHHRVVNVKIGLEKGCPPGTIPIRKLTQKHLTRARSSSQKLQFHSLKWNHGLDFAGIFTSKSPGREFHGTEGYINIDNPKVEPHQFSSAMISVESGEIPNLNQIQVGWTVNPELYGDTRTRLYTSWTTDNHQSTGCYNMLCPGFVQVNEQIPLDYVMPDISVYDGIQFDLYFYLAQENVTGFWWLFLHETDDVIGYWPNSIFTGLLGHAADTVRWGGQVFTPLSDDVSPPMGSGHFENGHYDRTCYMRQLSVFDGTFTPVVPDNSLIQTVDSRCYYEADNSYKDVYWQYAFLFGGEGGKDGSTCQYPPN